MVALFGQSVDVWQGLSNIECIAALSNIVGTPYMFTNKNIVTGVSCEFKDFRVDTHISLQPAY